MFSVTVSLLVTTTPRVDPGLLAVTVCNVTCCELATRTPWFTVMWLSAIWLEPAICTVPLMIEVTPFAEPSNVK